MNRREFLSSSGIAASILTGGLAEPAAAAVAAAPRKRALMKVSADVAPVDAQLAAAARFGIKNIVSHPEIGGDRLYATVDELKRMRDAAERHGISVDILTPPHLASSHIDREAHPGIMLAQSPERDREIEGFQAMIRNCAAAGVPCIKYKHEHFGRAAHGPVAGPRIAANSHGTP